MKFIIYIIVIVIIIIVITIIIIVKLTLFKLNYVLFKSTGIVNSVLNE